nr:PREDICTED: dynactin subunit 3 [Opisthocomus hoazin]
MPHFRVLQAGLGFGVILTLVCPEGLWLGVGVSWSHSVVSGAGVADELVKVQVALSSIAGKRERIKILFKKIEDVIKYLDPQYIDRMAVPDAMKLQFILAEEQVIPSRAALLEQVKNLQPILDSASILAVPDHAAKLQRLSQIHIQQQEQRQDLTDSVKTLLEDYNKMR